MGSKWVAVGLGALLLVTAAAVCFGEEEKREEKATTVTGKVSAAFDEDWTTKSVKVTTDKKESYNIVLDEKGQSLAWEDGEEVTVTGALTAKGTEKWLKVTAFKVVKAEEKKEEPKAEAKQEEKPQERKEVDLLPVDDEEEKEDKEDDFDWGNL